MAKYSERFFRGLMIWGAVGLSSIGFLVGICLTKNPTDAGRGGAVATMFVLMAFFLRRDIGPLLRHALTEVVPEINSFVEKSRESSCPEHKKIDDLMQRVSALEYTARIDGNSDRKMSRALAIGTGVGTLFWGFGDLVASFFISGS